jgi:hypothetical protein
MLGVHLSIFADFKKIIVEWNQFLTSTGDTFLTSTGKNFKVKARHYG